MITFRKLLGRLVFLGLILLSSQLMAGDPKPLIEYYLHRIDRVGILEKRINDTGERLTPNTVDLSDTEYFRGLDGELYDPVNKRIFFIAMYRSTPIIIHYYDFASRQIFDLPIECFIEPEYILSPDSKYLICGYHPIPIIKPYTRDQRKVIVMDAKSLVVVGERNGISLRSFF